MKIKCLVCVKKDTINKAKMAIHRMGENRDTNRESQADTKGKIISVPT